VLSEEIVEALRHYEAYYIEHSPVWVLAGLLHEGDDVVDQEG
jgi:hypothetical protein